MSNYKAVFDDALFAHHKSTFAFLFPGQLQEAADTAKSTMVGVVGLDSKKVQKVYDAADQEVNVVDKVQMVL
ncbi:hypothetical protein V6N13_139241 [Hibiscus sabdariffa]|uniref:Uncharacterized protein n=1 Tax=Hibiscus sabdariffa TaxID=183260 RepID=A0ABR2C8P9_9ROSI